MKCFGYVFYAQRLYQRCPFEFPLGQEERPAFEIEDRRPVVRAASLHPEPNVRTTIESTVSFEP